MPSAPDCVRSSSLVFFSFVEELPDGVLESDDDEDEDDEVSQSLLTPHRKLVPNSCVSSRLEKLVGKRRFWSSCVIFHSPVGWLQLSRAVFCGPHSGCCVTALAVPAASPLPSLALGTMSVRWAGLGSKRYRWKFLGRFWARQPQNFTFAASCSGLITGPAQVVGRLLGSTDRRVPQGRTCGGSEGPTTPWVGVRGRLKEETDSGPERERLL